MDPIQNIPSEAAIEYQDLYNSGLPDYTSPQGCDTSISISAVVSASCVIVNDQYHHDQNQRVPFSPDAFMDISVNESNYTPEQATFQRTDEMRFNPDTYPQEYGSYPNIQHPYCQEYQAIIPSTGYDVNNSTAEMSLPEDPLTYPLQTAYCCTTAPTLADIPLQCSLDKNKPTFGCSSYFDPTSVPGQEYPTLPLSSGESYLSDSSVSVDMGKRTNSSATQETCLSQDVSPLPTPNVNVDEMISSGVTVAGFKPRGIIRKRKKTKTPTEYKDGCYWSKRTKNNDSARRSREIKKEKERNFYKRALELEYENCFLKEKIASLENQLLEIENGFSINSVNNIS